MSASIIIGKWCCYMVPRSAYAHVLVGMAAILKNKMAITCALLHFYSCMSTDSLRYSQSW